MAPEQLTEMGLEWAQLSGAQQPFGPRTLNRATRILLLALRIYALVAVPLVVYVFLRALH